MQRNSARIQRRQVYRSGTVFSVGPSASRFLVLGLLAILSLLFLVQTAQGSDTLIKIRDTESRIQDADKAYDSLVVQERRTRSLQTLTEYSVKNGLVPNPSSPETININQ